MKKLLVVWKTDNDTDIHNFVIPYVYNSKKQDWFDDVELLIWGASQEKITADKMTQTRVGNLVKADIKTYACKMCADKVGATEVLESLGVEVIYTGVYLTEKLKDPQFEVITL